MRPVLHFVSVLSRARTANTRYTILPKTAKRKLDHSSCVLLSGDEDDDITDYFIRSAFPPHHHVTEVLAALEDAEEGLTKRELEAQVNLSSSQIEHVLKLMSVLDRAPIIQRREPHGENRRPKNVFYATGLPYAPDEQRRGQIRGRILFRRTRESLCRNVRNGHEGG
jgi:hypothetical protein